jgi:hypothetical protein
MVRQIPHTIQLVSPNRREKGGTEWGAIDVNHETTNWCRCEEEDEAHQRDYGESHRDG